MLKKRFEILKWGFQLHSLANIQNAIHSCLILWNRQRKWDRTQELLHLVPEHVLNEELDENSLADVLHKTKMDHFMERNVKVGTRVQSHTCCVSEFFAAERTSEEQKVLHASLQRKLIDDFTYRRRHGLIKHIRTQKTRFAEYEAVLKARARAGQ